MEFKNDQGRFSESTLANIRPEGTEHKTKENFVAKN